MISVLTLITTSCILLSPEALSNPASLTDLVSKPKTVFWVVYYQQAKEEGALLLRAAPKKSLEAQQGPEPLRGEGGSFTIDYERNTFLKDGRPFQYISGSLHYFRIPRELWRDRMLRVKALGFNAIQTYVQWNLHETRPGHYDFSGQLDFEAFIDLAQELGFLVILRAGPYVCAEVNKGGLPFWLEQLYPDIKIRTSDSRYLERVDIWFGVLMPKIRRRLYSKGGPIIMVQMENEYGSFGTSTNNCDLSYLTHLRESTKAHLGNDVILFTTDGNSLEKLQCGKIPEVYATVDFGTRDNVNKSFELQRLIESEGPLINSEFYPGWLDHWGVPHQKVSTAITVKWMNKMLDMGANINMYMVHGGTNFGFTNGANWSPRMSYLPQITSYDYDAPITEAGDLTPKYHAIRQLTKDFFKKSDLPTPPRDLPKGHYGRVELELIGSLFDFLPELSHGRAKSDLEIPPTFEELGQDTGFVLYERQLDFLAPDPALLAFESVRDRALVFVERELVGVLSRTQKIVSLPLQIRPGQTLRILLENQGRINHGPGMVGDSKGLGKATLGGRPLVGHWNAISLPMNTVNTTLLLQGRQELKNNTVGDMTPH